MCHCFYQDFNINNSRETGRIFLCHNDTHTHTTNEMSNLNFSQWVQHKFHGNFSKKGFILPIQAINIRDWVCCF